MFRQIKADTGRGIFGFTSFRAEIKKLIAEYQEKNLPQIICVDVDSDWIPQALLRIKERIEAGQYEELEDVIPDIEKIIDRYNG